MVVTHTFCEFNALIGLSYEIMTIMDKAMIDHLTVDIYGSIVTVYTSSPVLLSFMSVYRPSPRL